VRPRPCERLQYPQSVAVGRRLALDRRNDGVRLQKSGSQVVGKTQEDAGKLDVEPAPFPLCPRRLHPLEKIAQPITPFGQAVKPGVADRGQERLAARQMLGPRSDPERVVARGAIILRKCGVIGRRHGHRHCSRSDLGGRHLDGRQKGPEKCGRRRKSP
jgi:hypothetical protein